MANNSIVLDGTAPKTGAEFLETIQDGRFRAGGPSSSALLNQMTVAIQKDLTSLALEVADCVDSQRILSLALGAQEAGLARICSAMTTQMSGLTFGSTSTADLFLCERIVADPSQTSADITPLFGQATLPAVSRQNVLVVESPGMRPYIPKDAAVMLALQPSVTTSTGAQAPVDSAFGEDQYWPYCIDNDDRTFWPIEDPTAAGHMAWIEIRLPGDVSGGYRCNELEFIPFPLYGTSLVSVQAEVIGQGWRNLDFTYVEGYNSSSGVVAGLGPMRLCFPQSNIRRFRIGLFVGGFWGVSSVRVLHAVYASPATVTADFSQDNLTAIHTVVPGGKDPGALQQMMLTINAAQTTITLSSNLPSSTPVLTYLKAST